MKRQNIYLYPAKVRRAGGFGIFICKKQPDHTVHTHYELGFEIYDGAVSNIVRESAMPISEECYLALRDEANRNWFRMSSVVTDAERGE